jgi:hypothetical protein
MIREQFPIVGRLRPSLSQTFSEALQPENIANRQLKGFEKTIQKHESERMGYVIGPIADSNPLKAYKQVIKIKEIAIRAGIKHHIPVATPLDLTLPLKALTGLREGQAAVYRIQRKVLSEPIVTDVFVAPGWRDKRTTRDDHETAVRTGKRIHYTSPDEQVA